MNAGSLVILAVGALGALAGCAAPKSGTSGEATLRVMSFNVRCATANDGENDWTHRRELLVRTIRAFNPDLLGAQEVIGTQPADLREGLSGYAFIGVGRDDGREAGEMSPIMYRASRFQEIAHGTFWLSETPDLPGSRSWDAAMTRIATWVKLRDRGDRDRELLVINTHWDHSGTTARLRSAELIRTRMNELASGAPAIVIGDLNCTEDDPPHAVMIGAIETRPRLIDSYREVHAVRTGDEATFHAFDGTPAGSRIDFIHTPEYRALDATIDRTNEAARYSSDHFDVTAVLMRVK